MQDQDTSKFSIWGGFASWWMACILPMSSCDRVRKLSGDFLNKGTNLIHESSSTSWLHHLLNIPLPNTVNISAYEFGGNAFSIYPQNVVQFLNHSVQSFSCVWLIATPWTLARQASLSITNSWSPPKPMSIESVMPSNHLILCHPLLLLPSIPPSIRVFSNESALCIRWPKYWSFSFSINPSNEYPGLISLGWTGWISLQSRGLSRVFSNTKVQKHQFFGAQLSL